MYCDAHIHLVDLEGREPGFARKSLQFSWRGAVVSHDPAEFLQSEALRAKMPPTIAGFGIHPQNPDMQNATFLSSLCDEKKIQFIGETGFDSLATGRFDPEIPMPCANSRGILISGPPSPAAPQLPLVVHLRKATDVFMAYGRELDGVPSVIFHCWPGRLEEAKMILKKGINAYFSFGTPLLRDSKHAIESLVGLSVSRILSETDAPWQPPHGSAWTRLEHIVDVTDKMARVLEIDSKALAPLLEKNFAAAYLLDN